MSTVIGLLANPVRRYRWRWPRLAYVGFNGGLFALMQHASAPLQQLMQTGDRLRGQFNSAAALTKAGQALAANRL